MSLWN